MKISPKRTCNRCKALTCVFHKYFCELGYKTQATNLGSFLVWERSPTEPCPKPMTNDEHFNAPRKESPHD